MGHKPLDAMMPSTFTIPMNPKSLPPSQLLPPGEQLEHAHGPNLFRANSYDPKRFNLKDREGDEYDDQVHSTEIRFNLCKAC